MTDPQQNAEQRIEATKIAMRAAETAWDALCPDESEYDIDEEDFEDAALAILQEVPQIYELLSTVADMKIELSALRAANAKQEQRWIPTSEKLPEMERRCLVLEDGIYGIGYISERLGDWVTVGEHRDALPQFWQYLPPAPVVSSEPSP